MTDPITYHFTNQDHVANMGDVAKKVADKRFGGHATHDQIKAMLHEIVTLTNQQVRKGVLASSLVYDWDKFGKIGGAWVSKTDAKGADIDGVKEGAVFALPADAAGLFASQSSATNSNWDFLQPAGMKGLKLPSASASIGVLTDKNNPSTPSMPPLQTFYLGASTKSASTGSTGLDPKAVLNTQDAQKLQHDIALRGRAFVSVVDTEHRILNGQLIHNGIMQARFETTDKRTLAEYAKETGIPLATLIAANEGWNLAHLGTKNSHWRGDTQLAGLMLKVGEAVVVLDKAALFSSKAPKYTETYYLDNQHIGDQSHMVAGFQSIAKAAGIDVLDARQKKQFEDKQSTDYTVLPNGQISRRHEVFLSFKSGEKMTALELSVRTGIPIENLLKPNINNQYQLIKPRFDITSATTVYELSNATRSLQPNDALDGWRIKIGEYNAIDQKSIPNTHIVKLGEKIESIAAQYGLTKTELVELNPQFDSNKMQNRDVEKFNIPDEWKKSKSQDFIKKLASSNLHRDPDYLFAGEVLVLKKPDKSIIPAIENSLVVSTLSTFYQDIEKPLTENQFQNDYSILKAKQQDVKNPHTSLIVQSEKQTTNTKNELVENRVIYVKINEGSKESWSDIAKQYNIPVDKLLTYNNFQKLNKGVEKAEGFFDPLAGYVASYDNVFEKPQANSKAAGCTIKIGEYQIKLDSKIQAVNGQQLAKDLAYANQVLASEYYQIPEIPNSAEDPRNVAEFFEDVGLSKDERDGFYEMTNGMRMQVDHTGEADQRRTTDHFNYISSTTNMIETGTKFNYSKPKANFESREVPIPAPGYVGTMAVYNRLPDPVNKRYEAIGPTSPIKNLQLPRMLNVQISKGNSDHTQTAEMRVWIKPDSKETCRTVAAKLGMTVEKFMELNHLHGISLKPDDLVAGKKIWVYRNEVEVGTGGATAKSLLTNQDGSPMLWLQKHTSDAKHDSKVQARGPNDVAIASFFKNGLPYKTWQETVQAATFRSGVFGVGGLGGVITTAGGERVLSVPIGTLFQGLATFAKKDPKNSGGLYEAGWAIELVRGAGLFANNVAVQLPKAGTTALASMRLDEASATFKVFNKILGLQLDPTTKVLSWPDKTGKLVPALIGDVQKFIEGFSKETPTGFKVLKSIMEKAFPGEKFESIEVISKRFQTVSPAGINGRIWAVMSPVRGALGIGAAFDKYYDNEKILNEEHRLRPEMSQSEYDQKHKNLEIQCTYDVVSMTAQNGAYTWAGLNALRVASAISAKGNALVIAKDFLNVELTSKETKECINELVKMSKGNFDEIEHLIVDLNAHRVSIGEKPFLVEDFKYAAEYLKQYSREVQEAKTLLEEVNKTLASSQGILAQDKLDLLIAKRTRIEGTLNYLKNVEGKFPADVARILSGVGWVKAFAFVDGTMAALDFYTARQLEANGANSHQVRAKDRAAAGGMVNLGLDGAFLAARTGALSAYGPTTMNICTKGVFAIQAINAGLWAIAPNSERVQELTSQYSMDPQQIATDPMYAMLKSSNDSLLGVTDDPNMITTLVSEFVKYQLEASEAAKDNMSPDGIQRNNALHQKGLRLNIIAAAFKAKWMPIPYKP